VFEDGYSVAREMLVEGYAIARGTEDISERVLALLERLLPQIQTVDLD
jgi:hypothetical protein